MRTRALVLVALLTPLAPLVLPSALEAQRIRLPRRGQTTEPQPAPLPPESPTVNRALAYKRSRWSAEGYSLFSAVQVPSPGGGSASYTTLGAGTHADYRYNDRSSAAVDLTMSAMGSPVMTQTAEVGTRFAPLPWEDQLRPFFDVRATYLRMRDNFSAPSAAAVIGNSSQQVFEGTRYARGFGGIAGAGLEYSITHTFAVTTELLALRTRMTAYRMTGAANIPTGSGYWMTTYRYAVGLKFSPVRSLHQTQAQTVAR